jgi:hypothetical protein
MLRLLRTPITRLRAPDTRKEFGIWCLILGCGALLLYFRYDWSVGGGFPAKRGFWLSLYLLVIMLPTVFYLARRTLHSHRVATAVTALVFVVFTIPWHLLGLDSAFYYATRPRAFDLIQFPAPANPGYELIAGGPPRLAFLPGASLLQFPFEWLFVPLVLGAGAGLVWLVRWLRSRAGFTIGRRVPLLLTLAFVAICLQMFLHAGMRSPYTYLSYFQRPQSQHNWYQVYEFKNQTGAVEGDENAFATLENYFQGTPYGGYNELARRPFSFYIASQVSYFVNDEYVWLALNCLFWLVAVFATARLVTRLASTRAGLIAGALVVFGPGFIAFVSQTDMYMQNYAAAAIALCAFEDLVVSPADRGPRRYALFAGILALCGLTYDLEPIFLAILAYGLARRINWGAMIATVVGAYALVEGFTLMVSDALGIKIAPANEQELTDSLKSTLHLITHPSLAHWYDTFGSVMPSFVHMWLQAFFVIPPILALFGFRLLRDRPQKVLVATLFALYFAVIAVLQIGGTEIGTTPRLIYPAFISVYLPAAVLLDAIAEHARGFTFTREALLTGRGSSRALQRLAPWLVIGAMFVLVNIDIFGYPTLYVEYFVSTPPVFLPR